MTNTELQTLLSSWVEGLEFLDEKAQYLTVTVPKKDLRELMMKLRDEQETAFDYMFSLTGMDWGKNLGVVYHLESTKYRHIIVVHVNTVDKEENINLDTVSDIYPTANFHEREVFDLFGVVFDGHPNLKRIFLQDDWVGHPLRKDYVDEANMIVK
jgi:NADH/F420H2 dehydrogenase subunit C